MTMRLVPISPADGEGGRSELRSPQAAGMASEEFLSIADLCKRIPYAPQTIRNLMSAGVLKRNLHYMKPRGRIMFKWSAVLAWIEAHR
jgi:hypothetical protein